MQDHRVTDREVGDAVAYRVDPAGVLVSQHIGQPGILNGLPLPLDDVQVGPADPGAADPDDDVHRARDLRLRDFVDRRVLVVVVQPNSLHRACLPELDPTPAHPSRRAATTGPPCPAPAPGARCARPAYQPTGDGRSRAPREGRRDVDGSTPPPVPRAPGRGRGCRGRRRVVVGWVTAWPPPLPSSWCGPRATPASPGSCTCPRSGST